MFLLFLVLLAGTLRPDLIESASSIASSNAQCIKTHHNDTELVRELRKKVCWYMYRGWHQQGPIYARLQTPVSLVCLAHEPHARSLINKLVYTWWLSCAQGRVVEPLCDFHKDEVRTLGETLRLPRELLYRHPFPGEQGGGREEGRHSNGSVISGRVYAWKLTL